MKIGITGYRGFIGNSVAHYLGAQGHAIVSLDSNILALNNRLFSDKSVNQ